MPDTLNDFIEEKEREFRRTFTDGLPFSSLEGGSESASRFLRAVLRECAELTMNNVTNPAWIGTPDVSGGIDHALGALPKTLEHLGTDTPPSSASEPIDWDKADRLAREVGRLDKLEEEHLGPQTASPDRGNPQGSRPPQPATEGRP